MKIIEIKTKVNSYNIYFGSFLSECDAGCMDNKFSIADFFACELGVDISRKIAIISDDNVDGYYGELLEKKFTQAGYNIFKFVFKNGESQKNMDTVLTLSKSLLEANFNRGDLLIALGGGVVGDVVGFLSSVYMRGIDYIQIPTSLIAQVDSSIGGKTGVNTELGKNLIGSFYSPIAVLIDVCSITTLPVKYLKDGMGEVVKYSLIADSKALNDILLNFNLEDKCDLNSDNKLSELDNKIRKYIISNIVNIVLECVKIKKKYIEADEYDYGVRRILNFGHTIGHAIEKVSNYKYTHGACVAMGMYLISLISEELGWQRDTSKHKICEDIKSKLINFDLFNMELYRKSDEWEKYINNDKKNIQTGLDVIFLEDIGAPSIKNIEVDEFMDGIFCVLKFRLEL